MLRNFCWYEVQTMPVFIHLFVHYLCLLCLIQGHVGAGAYACYNWGRVRVHPGQAILGPCALTLTLTPPVN